MWNLASSSTEDSLTVLNIDPFNARSHRRCLHLFVLGVGLDYTCVCQWPVLENVSPVHHCPYSNPDLRRTEPVLESPLQRTSSGSSSSSSTPSSQPSSQSGSQPGSQAGSSERTRVRGKAFPHLSRRASLDKESDCFLTSVTPGPGVATTMWCREAPKLHSASVSLGQWATIPSHMCDISVDPILSNCRCQNSSGRSQNTGLIRKCSHQTAQFPFLFDCLVRVPWPTSILFPCVNSVQNTRYFSNEMLIKANVE